MSNTQHSPSVVASNAPVNGATPQAGSEVAVNPPAVVPVSTAVDAFASSSAPAIAALTNSLPAEPPKTGKRVASVNVRRQRAIPMLSELLRKYPNLSADHTSDDIDTPMADATACLSLGKTLTNLTARVNSTARVRLGTAATLADEVYALAEKKAKGNPDLARDLAPIRAILAVGSRANTAPVTAAKTQTAAARAAARATRASQKATRANAKAAAMKTGDAIITQPASTAPAAAGAPAVTIR